MVHSYTIIHILLCIDTHALLKNITQGIGKVNINS